MSNSTCKSCGVSLRWIPTKTGKMMPASVASFVRNGSEVPPEGSYVDDAGEIFNAPDVPCKVHVYRTHWQDCPGGDKFRRK